ncbi:MAG: prepilin peptidase [Pyrobaculum sp.]
MIDAVAVVALALLFATAAWQDLRTREIDVKIFAAMAPLAALLVVENWGSPFYFFSLGVGLLLALLMRVFGSGYADSLAMAAISTAPPLLPYLPTPFVVVISGTPLLLATVLWLYLLNRRRPCKMTRFEMLTHICVSRQEFLRNPLKYVVGDVRDMEHYDPSKVEIKDWVKAKYGVPYVVFLAAGFAVYTLIFLLQKTAFGLM